MLISVNGILIAQSNESNYALRFDGSNDLALINHNDAYSRPVCTIEFWFKPLMQEFPVTPTWADLVGVYCKASNNNAVPWYPRIALFPNSSSHLPPWILQARTRDLSGDCLIFNTEAIIEKEQWIHFALVLDNTRGYCYMDGILSASGEGRAPTSFDRAPIVLGQLMLDSASTRRFNGLMDEVRIWSVARSEEEIRRTMNLILEGNEPGLIGCWGFDEESGQSLIDSSPTGNSGFLGKTASVESIDPQRVVSDAPLHRLPAVNVTARIEPSVPRTLDDLQCIAEATPIGEGGVPPLDWSYRWFRNGVELTEGMEVSGIFHTVTGAVLSHVFTAKNDTLACAVRVSDGTYSFEQPVAPVTIVNSTPSAPVVKIIPENPMPWQGFAADIQVYSIDPDGDPVKYEIRWYRSQDGGDTFVYKAELSGIAPAGTWVPPAFMAEGDVWRVEAIPFEAPAQTKQIATAQEDRVEGEIAWWQVYVGTNSVPVVTIDAPGQEDVFVAGNQTRIAWSSKDNDGDAMTVELLYDFDDRSGGAMTIAQGLSASGSYQWNSPWLLPEEYSDLNEDSLLNYLDVFLLTGNWYQMGQDGQKVKIFARVRDAKGAIGEAVSEGWLIFPNFLPSTVEGIQEWTRQKKME